MYETDFVNGCANFLCRHRHTGPCLGAFGSGDSCECKEYVAPAPVADVADAGTRCACGHDFHEPGRCGDKRLTFDRGCSYSPDNQPAPVADAGTRCAECGQPFGHAFGCSHTETPAPVAERCGYCEAEDDNGLILHEQGCTPVTRGERPAPAPEKDERCGCGYTEPHDHGEDARPVFYPASRRCPVAKTRETGADAGTRCLHEVGEGSGLRCTARKGHTDACRVLYAEEKRWEAPAPVVDGVGPFDIYPEHAAIRPTVEVERPAKAVADGEAAVHETVNTPENVNAAVRWARGTQMGEVLIAELVALRDNLAWSGRRAAEEQAEIAALRAILARAERWIDDVDHQDLNLLDDIRAALGIER